MAWNEPGGSGRDPWGSPRGEQGPPDLDEAIRKLQARLAGIFGGRSGGNDRGGGGGPGGHMAAGGIGLIAALALIVWVLSGIYIVQEGTRAVVLQFGSFNEVTEPGPHWYPRFIQTVERVDVDNVRSIELGYRGDEALMLTQDENIIDIKFAVQYQVRNARDYLFNVRDPDETLRSALESAVREVVGRSEMDFVITDGRTEVVARAQSLLQRILDDYRTGLVVTSLNMQDAQAPQQVQGAFADAVKAREDEQRLKNEAEAYFNDIIPKARGQAERLRAEANAYRERVIAEAEGESSRFTSILAEYLKAPEITRQRIYIETMEGVLASSSKVLVDTEGNNNLLYLPLDRMTLRSSQLPAVDPYADMNDGSQTPARSAVENNTVRDAARRREVR
jgi:modulator of FtsH protease HflK